MSDHETTATAATPCPRCGAPSRPGRRAGRVLLCPECHEASKRGAPADPSVLPTRRPEPTDVPPGPARVDVYAKRYAKGEFIFCKGDAR